MEKSTRILTTRILEERRHKGDQTLDKSWKRRLERFSLNSREEESRIYENAVGSCWAGTFWKGFELILAPISHRSGARFMPVFPFFNPVADLRAGKVLGILLDLNNI
ncbi:hypothetical protein M9H77_25738 [Catharanthus roseus]|uniref:Uncharacterized protein n=1 Tax=Catharanthus roseus TaxID=4058 RepID=A0ACC0A9K0_CATRO|nr:hypothetical protein M9H77_25738 [Catharanthus roseus]